MTDRNLTATELLDLKEGRTLTKLPYFITVFKSDVIEPNGRNNLIPPSLYEMVLLEMISEIEVLVNFVAVQGAAIEQLKRDFKGKQE